MLRVLRQSEGCARVPAALPDTKQNTVLMSLNQTSKGSHSIDLLLLAEEENLLETTEESYSDRRSPLRLAGALPISSHCHGRTIRGL